MTFDVLDRLHLPDLFQAALRQFPAPDQLLHQVHHLSPKHQIYYFDWGRNALYWLIKTANWQTVAMPDFTCPVVIEAVTAAGAKPLFLKTDPTTLLLDQTKLKAASSAQAIIAVHTHGLVEDIRAIRHALPGTHIIEDCATALFSQAGINFVGRQGDSVLISLYKQVNGLNGAILTTKLKVDRYRQREPAIFQWKRLFLHTSGPWQWYLNRLRRYSPQQLRRFPFTANLSPSDLARNLFSLNFDSAREAFEKIQTLIPIYQKLTSSLPQVNPVVINPKTRPHLYRYPILIDHRDDVLLKLRSQRIFIDALWYDSYGNSEIAKRILTLPIKPHYTPSHVSQLFNALEQAMLILSV